MNITRENIDALNAIVKVEIAKSDYADKVNTVLGDYRKKANIPGFRKGHVPMGLVKKQYGKAVLVNEVNKLLQDALNKYLTEEKLDVLGHPLPKAQDDLNWDADDFSFEFELGLAPEFDVKAKNKKAITHYNIKATDKMIDDQIENITNQYGKLIAKDTVEKGHEITGRFFSEENEIDKSTTFSLNKIKGKKNIDMFLGAKVDDILTLKTKNLFEETQSLVAYVGVKAEDADKLNVEVTFTITEINERKSADLDQELFDKLFGKDVITSVTELRAKLKEDAEKQFAQQSDQKLLNDVTENLIENTKFDLPTDFLKKWIQTSGENPLSEDEASAEYEKSEKGLRYQLIEGKIINDNNLQVTFDEIKEGTKEMVKGQMAQFGQLNPSEEELDNIVARVLQNQDEIKRINEQMLSKKLIKFYKENANLKVKNISYGDFIKEVYR